MAESTTVFYDYVEKGSKLESFKDFFSAFESIGKTVTAINGIISQVSNIGNVIKSGVGAVTSELNSAITASLKKFGLTDKAISMLSSATGGMLTSADPYISSLYSTVEAYAGSVIGDALTAANSLYLPESTFLWSIKALASTGSDPNYEGTLRATAIEHDLVETLTWLDDYNGLEYDIDCDEAGDATTASLQGSFQIATYIMKKLLVQYKALDYMVATTAADIKKRDTLKLRYVMLFNKVIRNIFVYSYDNLTLSAFQSIISSFSTFIPAALGTTDETYSKRDLITAGNINILAPFYKVKSAISTKTYINPRNQNIKKLYVWLAFSTDYQTANLLVHKDLHDRLKYPILSTLEKAQAAAEKALCNSALGKFVTNVIEAHEALIANYILKIEDIIFTPKEQAYLQGQDTTIIPDYRGGPTSTTSTDISTGATTTSSTTSTSSKLPYSSLFSKYYLSYTDFKLYKVDDTLSNIAIAEATVSVVTAGTTYEYVEDQTITQYDPNTAVFKTLEFLMFYSAKYKTAGASDAEKTLIARCVLCKYLIDLYYTTLGYTLDAIAAIFPSLNSDGLISLFSDYYAALSASTASNTPVTSDGKGGTYLPSGSYVNYSSLAFYTQVKYSSGQQITIEDSGTNVYDSSGVKTGSFGSANGITGVPQGISIKDGVIFVATTDANDKTSVFYSTDDGASFTKDSSITSSALNFYAGTGVTDITQINFYSAFLYDSKVFSTNGTSINIMNGSVKISSISGFDGSVIGIAFMSNGKLYIITDTGVYEIADYTANPLVFTKIGDYVSGRYTIISDQIGTALNVVSINIDNVDDFDIDDTDVINALIAYYKSKSHVYYIFGQNKLTAITKSTATATEEEYAQSESFTEYVNENTKTDTTTVVTPDMSSFEKYLASCATKA